MSRHPALTIPILILFFSMLSFPQTVFTGASYGLVLWFRHVLPTLLPYMILINVLICTPALHWICRITSTFLCPLLGTSYYGTFAVLTGFLCGYPMGAKTTSDLLNVNKISRSEASYLLSFCNNISPAFILSYVVAQNMKERNLCIPFFLILTFTPLMLSFIFRLFYRLPESSCSFPQVTPGSFSNPSESISDSFLDRCILNAFESVTKVGGYMMMFSVLIQLLASVLPNTIFSLLLYSSLEISTGIRLLFSSALYTTEKDYPLRFPDLFRRMVLHRPNIFYDLQQPITDSSLYNSKTGHRIGNQSSYLRLHICYLIVS